MDDTSKHSKSGAFITAQEFLSELPERMESNIGPLVFASLRSARRMADTVVEDYNSFSKEAGGFSDPLYLRDIDSQFSDGETLVRLSHHVGGADVFLFQSLANPEEGMRINENYLSFLMAVRTFREHGANRITAVLPYLSYARQDKPTTFAREPTTAKLMADLSLTSGIDRLIAWDPHASQIRGFYGQTPVNMLDPLSFFVKEFEQFKGDEDLIAVAPDAGATKLIMRFGKAMEIQSAVAVKYRPTQEESVINDIIGDLRAKRRAIILDDLISSAGTVSGLIRILGEEKGIEEVYLAASHNLCLQEAYDKICDLHENSNLKKVIVTDSIPQTQAFQDLDFFEVRSLSTFLARTINRIHYNHSVSELFRGERAGDQERGPADAL